MEQQALFMRGVLLVARRSSAPLDDWKPRYYILRDLEGNLVACDVSEDEQTPTNPVGILQLHNAKVREADPVGSNIFPFIIEPASGKAWCLAAKSEQERAQWKNTLEEAIKIAPVETEQERNKHIEKLILQEKKASARATELKLLLLGPGQSGKSTVLKQMKILHADGFTPVEKDFYKSLCRSNILDITNQLLEAVAALSLDLSPPIKSMVGPFFQFYKDVQSKRGSGAYISSEDTTDDGKTGSASYGGLSSINTSSDTTNTRGTRSVEISPPIVQFIKSLWEDDTIQKDVMARAPEFHFPDSTSYFLDDIDRITSPDYTPTSQDILRSRHRTSGVIETIFLIDDAKFRIIDVGGQRGERKKWLSFFDDITAVIYVAAISEYDQKLREDDSTNRLHEALIVFENICKIKSFNNVPFILFLNKDDIFKEKIKKVPLNVCFKKYEGDNSYSDAIGYIKKKFERRRGFKERVLYIHSVTATDTESFKQVSMATQDIILSKALKDAHL